MRIRSSSLPSLLRLTLLILSTLGYTVTLVAAMRGESQSHEHRVSKRIYLPRAVDISRRFACREPQTRAYNLRDLMQSLYQNTGESVSQPVYVALKRCDGHSGCCTSPDMSCTPVKSATYYEEMEIQIWSLETNDTRRQWIRVEQHGRCACEVTTVNDRHRLEHQHPGVALV